jgi:hypothetical protein
MKEYESKSWNENYALDNIIILELLAEHKI